MQPSQSELNAPDGTSVHANPVHVPLPAHECWQSSKVAQDVTVDQG